MAIFCKSKIDSEHYFTKQLVCTQFVSFWIKLFFSVWWSSVYDQTSFSSSQCPSSFWILMASHFDSILLSPGTSYRSVKLLIHLFVNRSLLYVFDVSGGAVKDQRAILIAIYLSRLMFQYLGVNPSGPIHYLKIIFRNL